MGGAAAGCGCFLFCWVKNRAVAAATALVFWGDLNVCGKRGEGGGDQVGVGLVSLVMWRSGIGAPDMQEV